MALGRQQQGTYPFPTPPDEAPAPVPAQAEPVERRQNGQVSGSEAAAKLGRRGGLKRAERKRDAAGWGSRLGLGRFLAGMATNEQLKPYIEEGEQWFAETCADLGQTAGNGRLSPSVVSMVASASWQRLFGRYLMNCAATSTWGFDRAADEDAKPPIKPNTELVMVASRLLDASRQNCIAAFEIASREGAARPNAEPAFVVQTRAALAQVGEKKGGPDAQ